jgi:hypothetical protein
LFVLELSTYLLNKKNQNPELCNTFPMYVHFTNRKNPLYVHVRAFYIYKKNSPTKLIHSYNLSLLFGLRKLKLERNYNVFNFKIHAVQISYLSIFIKGLGSSLVILFCLFLNCPHIPLIKRIRILNYAIPFLCTCILQIGRTQYMYMYVHFTYIRRTHHVRAFMRNKNDRLIVCIHKYVLNS